VIGHAPQVYLPPGLKTRGTLPLKDGPFMRSVITQSIVLPASAEELYTTYLDPKLHAAVTGAPVAISALPGSAFRAFDGSISGTTLSVIAPRLIIQSWRSIKFHDNDPDSTLILSFAPEGSQGRIDLIHIDVPEQDFLGVSQGWEQYYWTPWRNYLAHH
jgi:activator of HSP90 ATPase